MIFLMGLKLFLVKKTNVLLINESRQFEQLDQNIV